MAVEVARRRFTVPLGVAPSPPPPEEEIVYSGGFTAVTFDRPRYPPGAEVKMTVEYWVERTRGWKPLWYSLLEAFNIGVTPPRRVASNQATQVGMGFDREVKRVTLTFNQVDGGLRGMLRLSCFGSKAVEVARTSFNVPIEIVKDVVPIVPDAQVLPKLGLGVLVIGALVIYALTREK